MVYILGAPIVVLLILLRGQSANTNAQDYILISSVRFSFLVYILMSSASRTMATKQHKMARTYADS